MPESVWMPPSPSGCPRVRLDAPESVWMPPCPSGCPRVRLDAPESVWMPPCPPGLPRVRLDYPVSVWMPPSPSGCPRVRLPRPPAPISAALLIARQAGGGPAAPDISGSVPKSISPGCKSLISNEVTIPMMLLTHFLVVKSISLSESC